MVSPIDRAATIGADQILKNTTTSSVSSSSFVQELESALQQFISQSGNGSGLQINIQPQGSQNSGGSQFLVTVTQDPATPPAPVPSTAAATSVVPAATATGPASTAAAPAAATPGAGTVPSADAGAFVPLETTPSDLVQVSFGGGGTAMVPTLAWEIKNHDFEMGSAAMSPDAILNEDQGEQMEPQAQQTVPGTSLKWDDLTQDQQMAYLYGSDYGFPTGQTMQQFLDANTGPQIMANAPANNPYLFGNS